ncbi:MAG: hypothetical protein M9905_04860 [Rhizobiaceae bacterium]|nr:hypothetical protein [Rhizobiaceae bacterium]
MTTAYMAKEIEQGGSGAGDAGRIETAPPLGGTYRQFGARCEPEAPAAGVGLALSKAAALGGLSPSTWRKLARAVGGKSADRSWQLLEPRPTSRMAGVTCMVIAIDVRTVVLLE